MIFIMLAGYWHKEGLEVFRLSGDNLNKVAAGALSQLKPVKGLGKKVLIVGRERLLHTRRRYPSASYENIKKAVQMEIEDLFPLKNPCHFLRIFDKTDTYTVVDIWAWDCLEYNDLKAVFPFTHLLPEDLAFISDTPEITIFGRRDITYLLAHSKDGFLGVSTLKGDVTPRALHIFLRGLGRKSGGIKKINLYKAGISQKEIEGDEDLRGLSLDITERQNKGYPACLESIGMSGLKEFRVGPAYPAFVSVDMVMRAALYLLIAWGFSLYLTGRNYDSAIKDIKTKTDGAIRELASVGAVPKDEDNTDTVAELNEILKRSASPLGVLETLAGHLPEKSSVTRMVLNEKGLELSLSSKEPLDVIKSLGEAGDIKAVKLKGAPFKDNKGDYNFVLAVELK